MANLIERFKQVLAHNFSTEEIDYLSEEALKIALILASVQTACEDCLDPDSFRRVLNKAHKNLEIMNRDLEAIEDDVVESTPADFIGKS